MLLQHAEKYIGIPWKAHGRTAAGLDCYGLVLLFYKDVYGIELPDFEYTPTGTAVQAAAIYNSIHSLAQAVPAEEESPGDVLLLTYHGEASHIAIDVGSGYILHAARGIGVCLTSLNTQDGVCTIASRVKGRYKWQIQ